MIASLEGTIQKKLKGSIILRTNGVGYEVFVNQNSLDEINEEDSTSLFIHTAVREDDIRLFGFLTFEELKTFKLLITVSGVGPKSGLEILNNPVASIKYAISNGETSLLTSTPGIGKKTADRIIVDLKEKIGASEKPEDYSAPTEMNEDVFSALLNLGYHRQIIRQTLKKIPDEIRETEKIIRYFLQNI